jgi:hypothetical protein
MKLTSLTFIFFLLNNLTMYNVPVKNQIKWTCDANWMKIEKVEERQFDEKENLTKWIQYTSGGSLCDEFKYEYGGTNKIKEYRKNCFQSYDRASVKNYKYGINNRIEEENTFENKKLTTRSKFKFKTPKDKYPYLREDYFDGENEPATIANLTYDKNGNLLEEEQLVSGSWFGTYTYKFNNRGQLIYHTGSVDGGVGLVEYFYIYGEDILIKDSVKIPDTGTEYHIYQIIKIK